MSNNNNNDGDDSNNNNNNNNNNTQLICGVNFQNAIKTLMTAHSNDLLDIENEFQVQKSNWDQERVKMIELINKLKIKNQSLKTMVIQYKQQLESNGINNSMNSSISSTDSTPIRSPHNSNNSNKGFLLPTTSKLSPIISNNNTTNTTATTTKTSTNNTPPSSASSNTTSKKRKKKEEVEKELDELDLPDIQQQQDDEVNSKLDFLSTDNINSSQSIMNKYSQQLSQSPSQQQQVKKKIKIKEVVRHKEEREKLQGFDCAHCKEFYDAVLGDDESKKKQMLDQCSRHRHSDEPPSTPPGFWNFGFPDSPMKSKDNNNNNNNI